MDITNKGNMISIMALLFTQYDVARNFYVLHLNFSIPRATSYSVNSQATVLVRDLVLYFRRRKTRFIRPIYQQ